MIGFYMRVEKCTVFGGNAPDDIRAKHARFTKHKAKPGPFVRG